MRITYKDIVAAGACSHGRKLFCRLFGKGGEVTPEFVNLWADNYHGSSSFVWPVNNLLRPEARKVYYSSRDAHIAHHAAFLMAVAVHDKAMKAMG